MCLSQNFEAESFLAYYKFQIKWEENLEIGAGFEGFSDVNFKFSSSRARQKQATKNLCCKCHSRQNLKSVLTWSEILSDVTCSMQIQWLRGVLHSQEDYTQTRKLKCSPNLGVVNWSQTYSMYSGGLPESWRLGPYYWADLWEEGRKEALFVGMRYTVI